MDLKCPACGRVQTSQGALRLHMAGVHGTDADAAPPERPTPRAPGFPLWAAVLSVLVAAGAAAVGTYLAVEATGTDATTTTTAAPEPSTSTSVIRAPPPTTAPPPPTSPPAPVTTEPALVPGSACTLGSHPDCIDPDGDGAGTYLLYGADCMRDFREIDATELCEDLDGGGVAGYPDSG